MVKSKGKREFHFCGVFSIRALLRQGRHVKCEFHTNSKDQLVHFNQKLITAINTLDGSRLGNNLITSRHLELIPAEAVANNQEHLVANKVGSITKPLV